jgi:hypothetical protein
MVQATYAGIEGWAAAVLAKDAPKTGQEAIMKAALDTTAEQPHARRKGPGKEEEERMLQMALLESVGAHPTMLKEPGAIYCIRDINNRDDDDDDDDDGDGDDDSVYKYDDSDGEDSSCCSERNSSCEEEAVVGSDLVKIGGDAEE